MSSQDPLPSGARARFGSHRFRTPGPIAQLAAAPDGRFVAAAGGHGLALVHPEDGTVLKRLKGSDAGFAAVAFADHAAILAAAGPKEVRLWETREFSELRMIEPPRSGVQALAVAPDGLRIFTGGRDRIGRVWDVASGKGCFELERPFNMGPSAAVYSPDGRWIATVGPYESLELWDAERGTCEHAFGEPGWMPCAVAFSPDGRRVLGASVQGKIIVWDPALRVRRGQFEAHPEEITSVRFSPDGALLVTASRDRTVRAWDAVNFALRWEHTVLDTAPVIALDPTRRSLFVGGERRVIHRLGFDAGERLGGPDGHQGALRELSVHPDGEHFASAGTVGSVLVWSLTTGESRRAMEASLDAEVGLSSDATVATVVDRSASPASLRLVDLTTAQARCEVDPGSAKRAVPSRGGGAVAVVTNFGSLRVLDPSLERAREVHGDAEDVLWSHDGETLLTRTRRSALRLFEASTMRELHRLTCAKVECMVLSRDGAEVHASGSTGVLHRWSARDGRELARERVASLEVQSLDRSPDGSLLALGTHDGVVKLCDPITCAVLGAVQAHEGSVRALRFTVAGDGLLSGGEDGIVMLWEVALLRGAEVKAARELRSRRPPKG